MEYENLMAFIQVAITIDFALILINAAHPLAKTVSAFLESLGDKDEEIKKAAESTHSILSLFDVRDKKQRKCRESLKRCIQIYVGITKDAPQRWIKYSYLGLFSGIVGVFYLLLIALRNVFLTEQLWEDMLVSISIFTLIWEIIILVQLSYLREARRMKGAIMKKGIVYVLCLLLVIGITSIGVIYRLPLEFKTLFYYSSVIIVLSPMIVLMIRAIGAWIQADQTKYKMRIYTARCKEIIEKIKPGSDACVYRIAWFKDSEYDSNYRNGVSYEIGDSKGESLEPLNDGKRFYVDVLAHGYSPADCITLFYNIRGNRPWEVKISDYISQPIGKPYDYLIEVY